MTMSRFTPVAANSIISFFFMSDYYSMIYLIFIHLSVDGHLGCFHVLAITNSAAMKFGVHVYFQITIIGMQDHMVILVLVF